MNSLRPGILAFMIAASGLGAWSLGLRDEYLILYEDLENRDTIGYRSHFDEGANAATGAVNHSQGCLAASDDVLMVALLGKGYFALRDGGGRPYYSRRARLVVGENGEFGLVDDRLISSTAAVAGIVARSVLVRPDGAVLVGGDRVGEIEVYELDDEAVESRIGDRIYTRSAGARRADGEYRVVQGCVETSNVDVEKTLIRMLYILESEEPIEAKAFKRDVAKAALSRTGAGAAAFLATCLPFLAPEY